MRCLRRLECRGVRKPYERLNMSVLPPPRSVCEYADAALRVSTTSSDAHAKTSSRNVLIPSANRSVHGQTTFMGTTPPATKPQPRATLPRPYPSPHRDGATSLWRRHWMCSSGARARVSSGRTLCGCGSIWRIAGRLGCWCSMCRRGLWGSMRYIGRWLGGCMRGC